MAAKRGKRSFGHIRKLESGRFQASFVGPDFRRYNGPKPFDSKTYAEGWLAKERELIQRSSWTGERWLSPTERRARVKVKGQTVESYAQQWITQRNLKPRTRLLYLDLLERHITPALGAIGIGNLSADDVNRWYAKTLIDRPTARAHAYSLLHAICASAVEQELIARNPCQIRGAMTSNRKREPVLLSVSELAAVADAINPRFKMFVLLSAWAALRFGEITELRVRDVGEDCSTITVSRAVTHRKGCRIDTPKNSKTRTIILPPHIRSDLKHHLDTHVAKDVDALLFSSARGACHLSQNVFREVVRVSVQIHWSTRDYASSPSPLRRNAGSTSGCHGSRGSGPSRALDSARGHALPTFRERPSGGHRGGTLGDR